MSFLDRLRRSAARAAAAARAPAPPPQALDRRAIITGGFLKGLAHLVEPTVARIDAARQAMARAQPAQPAKPIPLLRPPGAIREEEFLAGCTRCMDCAAACPHGAIIAAPIRLGAAAGTPTIDILDAPCRMCPDMPCIAACAPGVLSRDLPVRMGTAEIVAGECLAHRGEDCRACADACPVPGAVAFDGGRPAIDPSLCTGCGACAHACPRPEAILVRPAMERPPRPIAAQR